MNEKRTKMLVNYFVKWDGMGVLGIGIAAVGFLMLWLGFSYMSYILASTLMPIGLIVFLIGSIGRASESDLQAERQNAMESIGFKEIEENEGFRFRGRVPKNPEEKQFECYSMRDGLYFKRLKSGELCSSEAIAAKMLILNDSFLIKKKTFSLIDATQNTETYEIFFSSLESISAERESGTVKSINNKSFFAKTCELRIVYDGGKVCSIPAKDDLYTDEFVEKLKRNLLGGK